MIKLLPKLKIRVNEHIYQKDPDTSDLGRNIIRGGIQLINELGFESFTFKKLATLINATETSIYRYFDSKHRFLLYLSSWYWGWVEYNLVVRLENIKSPEERLQRAIHILTERTGDTITHPYIDLEKLENIIISELSKTYMTREVEKEDKEGVYDGFANVIDRVGEIVLEINPGYRFPRMLVSTIIIGAFNQLFFKGHLPGLTDRQAGENDLGEFYAAMVLNSIK